MATATSTDARAHTQEKTPPVWAERLWSSVDQSAGPESCWPWTAGRTGEYGCIKINGKSMATHRAAYIATYGELRSDQVVRHFVCNNPICCNPSHFKIGTHADNVADRVASGRSAKGTKHGRAKLNPEKVAEVWQMLGEGMNYHQISKIFSVDSTVIRQIFLGKCWKEYMPEHIRRQREMEGFRDNSRGLEYLEPPQNAQTVTDKYPRANSNRRPPV